MKKKIIVLLTLFTIALIAQFIPLENKLSLNAKENIIFTQNNILPWAKVKILHTLKGHIGSIDAVAFTPNGKYIFSGGGENDGELKLWIVKNGKLSDKMRASSGAIRAIAITNNGEFLASCGNDANINLWSLTTKKFLGSLINNNNNILSLVISNDNQTIITSGLDGIKIWNVKSKRPVYILARQEHPTYSLAIHPNGYILASGSKDGKIKIWDLKTGNLIDKITAHKSAVTGLGFTSLGNTLISTSYDRTVKVWDFNQRRLVKDLIGHSDRIQSLAMNINGEIIATASRDGIRIWNIKTGELVNLLTQHSDWVQSLAFSRDGNMLASGSLDQKVIIWKNEGTDIVVPPIIGNTRNQVS